MIAAGIDLGGTKIEAQVFDEGWQTVRRKRVDTPKTYDGLLQAMGDMITWIGAPVPTGVAAAGLVNSATGEAFTANLPATGHPFPADITAVARRPIGYFNDCRALTLSEAIFGAGQDRDPVIGLILGTGVGGGIAFGRALHPGPGGFGGEFGHTPAPAHVVARLGLPIDTCGCGRQGCIETYIAGPGLTRLAQHITGQAATPAQIADQRAGTMAEVWQAWLDLVAELLVSLTLTIDPEVIVLGGGLSKIEGVTQALAKALGKTQLSGFPIPEITLAQGGDTSGARGAAYGQWQIETGHG